VEDVICRTFLDHPALLHHVNAARKSLHDPEIVGDVENCHAELLLQLGQQPQDFCLDRHVECGRRLVSDQKVRVVGERHGDHHALALSSRELVRIGFEPPLRIRNVDQLQELQRLFPRRGSLPIKSQARRWEYPLSSMAQSTAVLLEPGVRSFCQHLAQRRHVHHRLRQKLLQACILLFQRLQPLGLPVQPSSEAGLGVWVHE